MLILGRVWILLVLNFSIVYAVGVEATVDRKEVFFGESVELNIKAMGEPVAFPKINEIDGIQVTDIGTSRQSSIQVTFGDIKSETATIRTYRFEPQKDMLIPSYVVNIDGKRYKTKPLHIKVLKDKPKSNSQFSFILSSDKKSVYVGESFIVTISMSVSNTLRGIQISDYIAPTAKNFFIKEMDGQKEYQRNTKTVIEKKYIITTKKEGNFTISPAKARLGKPDMRRQDIFGRYAMHWSSIISNALTIEVKAQASDTDLVGDFDINVSLDTQNVKANKPVNLTVKIKGKGSLEDFEFPDYEIDGVTIYSDEAKVESHVLNNKLVSTYSKSFAFISDNDFAIPKQRISTYNPNTKKKKILEVPGYHIYIKDKKNVATPSVKQEKKMENKELVPSKVMKKEVVKKSMSWWMLIVAFILGIGFVYFLRFILKFFKEQKKSYKEDEALKILYAHMSNDTKVEAMVRKLYAKKNGDASVQIDKKELKALLERFR